MSLRRTEINQRRSRRKKLTVLREKLKDAKSAMDKERILTKISRIAPWMTMEEGAKHSKKA